MKYASYTLILCYITYVLRQELHMVWVTHVVQDVIFSDIYGVINTLHLVLWVPALIVYGALGYLLRTLIKSNSTFWLFFAGAVIVLIEYSFSTVIYTEHSTLLDAIWMHSTYYVSPIIGLAAGHILRSWLTRRSSETTLDARPLS